jgi:uncharacterized protein (UPF0248 family)
MVKAFRNQFNNSFTEEKYKELINDLNASHNFHIRFRVAETPVFISSNFKQKLIQASDEIISFITAADFKEKTNKAIPAHCFVPNENRHSHFLALDFAIVKDDQGELQPRLIELQGFPSLFGFQDFLGNAFKKHYPFLAPLQNHFGLSSTEYKQLLKKFLLGNHQPKNVVLLEIDPLNQNTAIDFIITEEITGVKPIHIGDVILHERKLFYKAEGKLIPIHRIYNRVIFDELLKRTDLQLDFNLTEDVEVEWVGHPNWFFRVSKFTMPLIQSKYVPECTFLNNFETWPADLENYVLKPLFSFSGSGIVFHLTQAELDRIPKDERKNYLLQRKVVYEPVIQAPDGLVKTELRLLFSWEENEAKPRLITNLARLSRGEMIGVKFNKDKTWVGGSVCFFEE